MVSSSSRLVDLPLRPQHMLISCSDGRRPGTSALSPSRPRICSVLTLAPMEVGKNSNNGIRLQKVHKSHSNTASANDSGRDSLLLEALPHSNLTSPCFSRPKSLLCKRSEFSVDARHLTMLAGMVGMVGLLALRKVLDLGLSGPTKG